MSEYKIPVLSTFDWQPSVLDKDLNTPPQNPVKGDRYIVGASPTGDWAGHAGDIALFTTVWEFTTKKEGMACYVKDEDKIYVYVNSWVTIDSLISHTNLQNIGTNTHAQIDNFIGKVYPKFRATMSADQTITTGTYTKVNFDTETFDTNNNYNPTNKRFTPTVSGYYLIFSYIWITTTVAGTCNIHIYKNGSSYRVSRFRSDATAVGMSTMDIIYLNGSTDYVEIYVYQNIATTVTVASNPSVFTGTKLMD